MCEQGLHTKGQGAIVLHVIVVALGTECHLLISVDIPITETAKTGAILLVGRLDLLISWNRLKL